MFESKHSTSLQLTIRVNRTTRNFAEKKLTVAVFLEVAKAFVAIWMDGVHFKLTILNLPSYLVQTISAYLRGRKFEVSYQTATSSRRVIQVWVKQAF